MVPAAQFSDEDVSWKLPCPADGRHTHTRMGAAGRRVRRAVVHKLAHCTPDAASGASDPAAAEAAPLPSTLEGEGRRPMPGGHGWPDAWLAWLASWQPPPTSPAYAFGRAAAPRRLARVTSTACPPYRHSRAGVGRHAAPGPAAGAQGSRPDAWRGIMLATTCVGVCGSHFAPLLARVRPAAVPGLWHTHARAITHVRGMSGGARGATPGNRAVAARRRTTSPLS